MERPLAETVEVLALPSLAFDRIVLASLEPISVIRIFSHLCHSFVCRFLSGTGHSLSAYAGRHVFAWCGPYRKPARWEMGQGL